MTDYDVPIIKCIKKVLHETNQNDVDQYSRCVGSLRAWLSVYNKIY